MKIAIIDDDKVYRVLAGKIMESTKIPFSLEHFDDAEEALDIFLKGDNLPDVVFLDLNMPTMDGWELLDLLNEHKIFSLGGCKLYIVSSSNNEEDRKRAVCFPQITDYLVKPILKEKYLEIFKTFELNPGS